MAEAVKILFSYNLHGNVDTVLQDYGNSTGSPNAMNTTGNRFKKIVYEFDLISGKVNAVNYQPNQADAFYHRYIYDAENKITDVQTSHDKIVWERDARYYYYKHGPLARTVLGQNQVQGIDYAYTLQGQLKGINSTSVGDGNFDMGKDGKIGSSNSNIARDVYGISLNYFTGDYKPIALNTAGFANPFAGISVANDLFNGNIKSQVVNIPKLGDPLIYGYKYDQLNRLVAMDAYNGLNNATNTFTAITINDYKERLSYDPNGNIKTYLRNGTGATINLNNYSYTYTAGTNKLASITNSVNAQTKNYAYDPIGNTTTDGMQNMTNAVWNVYGKLQSAINNDGASVSYTYSADGQRISKKVGAAEEWYVKDVIGYTMATYSRDPAVNNNHLSTTEFYKYGSSLLSIKNHVVDMEVLAANNGVSTFTRGEDNYILIDGNGNTRATIKDTRTQVPDPANPLLVSYYTANVSTATFSSTYGANAKTFNGGFEAANFNGQRKSLEIGSDAQTAEFWEYNGDVARRANLDPKPNNSISPYNCFAANPIFFNDIKGDTFVFPRGGLAGALFEFKFLATVGFLYKKGAGDIAMAIAKHPKTVKVVPLDGAKTSYYEPLTGTLFWNPRLGIKTTNDVILSPATVLNHELDHALEHLTKPYKEFKENGKSNVNNPYQTKEEQRVITGSEKQTALKLGEITPGQETRTDHDATDLLLTNDPTSTKGELVPYNRKKVETMKEVIIVSKKKKK